MTFSSVSGPSEVAPESQSKETRLSFLILVSKVYGIANNMASYFLDPSYPSLHSMSYTFSSHVRKSQSYESLAEQTILVPTFACTGFKFNRSLPQIEACLSIHKKSIFATPVVAETCFRGFSRPFSASHHEDQTQTHEGILQNTGDKVCC